MLLARVGLVLIALFAWAVPAQAQVKSFTADIDGKAALAAGTVATVTATISNTTKNHQVGSSNVTAPAGYQVLGARTPRGTATVNGQTVELRNLALPKGQSMTAEIDVALPCAGGDGVWAITAKQANNYQGPPGNDVALDAAASDLVTEVAGGCGLRFVQQPPAQVGAGDPFTVSVELLDGAGNRATGSSAPVSLALVPAGGTLGGATTVDAAGGLATFSGISITGDDQTFWRLEATSPGSGSATSSETQVHRDYVECPSGTECTVQGDTGNAGFQVTALGDPDPTLMLLDFNIGTRPDCANYTELSPDFAVWDAPNRRKRATFTLENAFFSGLQLEFCFAAPYPFTTKLLTPAPQVGGEFVGLLPDCIRVTETGVQLVMPPPCVLERFSEGTRRAIRIDLPDRPEDPKGTP